MLRFNNFSNKHSSANGGFISDHGSSSKFVYCLDMCFKPGFRVTVIFREGVLRFPFKTDYIFCIMYSVLNNLPLPVIIYNNEYWQYLKSIIRCKWNSSEINGCVHSEQ